MIIYRVCQKYWYNFLMDVAVSRYMPHPKVFVQLLLDVFFTYSENLIILSFFKIDLCMTTSTKKLGSKKVDLAHSK